MCWACWGHQVRSVASHGVCDPVTELTDPGVHSWLPGQSTASPVRRDSVLIPLVPLVTHQGSSWVTLRRNTRKWSFYSDSRFSTCGGPIARSVTETSQQQEVASFDHLLLAISKNLRVCATKEAAERRTRRICWNSLFVQIGLQFNSLNSRASWMMQKTASKQHNCFHRFCVLHDSN